MNYLIDPDLNNSDRITIKNFEEDLKDVLKVKEEEIKKEFIENLKDHKKRFNDYKRHIQIFNIFISKNIDITDKKRFKGD